MSEVKAVLTFDKVLSLPIFGDYVNAMNLYMVALQTKAKDQDLEINDPTLQEDSEIERLKQKVVETGAQVKKQLDLSDTQIVDFYMEFLKCVPEAMEAFEGQEENDE